MRRPGQPRDETGAALVVALIFVTVVGLGSAMLLSFTDTNFRTTVSLREQTARAYAADGAAQVAVNALRQSTFTNAEDAKCAGSDLPMSLAPFASGTTRDTSVSTLVTCERKTGVAPTVVQPPPPVQQPAVINATNTLKFALQTLSTNAAGENGVAITGASAVDVFDVKGKIASNSTLKATTGVLRSDTSVNATTSCTGTITAPTKSCSGTTQSWPPYDAPTAAAVAAAPARTTPTCPSTGGLVTFSPGIYTNATTLSACDRANITMWFQPGTYYFNFPSTAPTWTLNLGSMVGGTPTANISTTVPVMPGSCVSPLAPAASSQYTPPEANKGVQFVFAGPSQWVVGGSAKVEICGSYSATALPVAIYGLQVAAGTLPAQNGCTISATSPCAMISSTTATTDTNSLYVQGTTHVAKALVSLTESRVGVRRTTMAFNGGVVARSVIASLGGVSSIVPAMSFIGVPTATAIPPLIPNVPIPQPNLPEVLVLLKVYTCPGTRACTTADRLALTAKVGVSNPATGAVVGGARAVAIYSWATQR